MLKLFAILSVALALTVNPGKKDQSPDQAKRDSGNNGTPTAAALLDDKISTPDTKSAKAESPPWYTSAEWWLFILGIPTLIVIAFQAIASKQAAEAALLNAKALISSERPWLVVSIERSEYEQPDVFIVSVRNKGNTPASFEGGRWGHGDYLESEPFTPRDTDFNAIPEPAKTLIVGNDGFEISKETPFANIQQNHLFGRKYCIFGEITYRDTFANPNVTEPYITRWCFDFTLATKKFRRCQNWHNDNT